MTIYLSLMQVLEIQRELLAVFGGLAGIRFRAGLEAAVARPAMTFGGEDLYPGVSAKAAELMLDINGIVLAAGEEELERVTLATARGELSAEALAIWFRQRWRTLEA